MIVLGVHIRVSGGRYLAGFAAVEGDRLVRPASLAAPTERPESGQLDELHGSTLDLIRELAPHRIALRGSEAGRAAQLLTAQHAEGAVLAAAGDADLSHDRFITTSLWKPAGLERAGAAASIEALCQQLRNPPPGPDEVRAAAAAARAAIVRADA